ncbi:hypothetical protein M885DRAFT_590441 [Pelagophyceae sp. CCMP2097]|nr:hypothetical protein M885DRAFT_590441 [Pelagophyceae sp. CCMP2097]
MTRRKVLAAVGSSFCARARGTPSRASWTRLLSSRHAPRTTSRAWTAPSSQSLSRGLAAPFLESPQTLWGHFPRRNATFGVDASGRRLVHVSRTSKLWMVRRMLRTEIHLLMRKPKGLVNSTVVTGVDEETWSIITAALDGVQLLPGKSVKKTYAASTRELVLYRSVTNGSTVTASFVTTAAFVVLGNFLGNNWNVSVDTSTLKGWAARMAKEHRLASADMVRAIVEHDCQSTAPALASDADGDSEDNFEDASSSEKATAPARQRRPRPAKKPGVVLKYDLDAGTLSIAVCWWKGPFSQVREKLLPTPWPTAHFSVAPRAPSSSAQSIKPKQRKRARVENVYEGDEQYAPKATTWQEWETKPALLQTRTRSGRSA